MHTLRADALDLFGIRLSDRHVAALANYERILLAWNQKHNLTAIRDARGIRTKHFLDSFSCILSWKENPPNRLIDIGTGAGFPGLPLKILYPGMQLTLIESLSKKAAFCQYVVDQLQLENVRVLRARAEEIGRLPEHREQYDWAVARAVAKVRVLAEYLLPLVRVGGCMLAQKGEAGLVETHAAESALQILGGAIQQLLPLTLPGVSEQRYLVVVKKVAATPASYPRKPGLPSKQPL